MASNGFTTGFKKTAGIAGLMLKPLKWAGKAAVKAGGGPLATGLTAMGAVSDYSRDSKKLQNAAVRG